MLIEIRREEDIPKELVATPIADLIKYHNLGFPPKTYASAEILISMCMDNRKELRIPENFAYIIRTGGGNLRYSEFKVSYAIGIGGVKYIALLGHNNCGMVNLVSQKEDFIQGLCENANWDRQRAEEHFMNYAPLFEINNELDFVVSEAARLKILYPGIVIVPLFYKLEDDMLYSINY
ncbi:MAG: carbonic anhydrase [Vulcanibacillus sp.]